MKFAQSKGSNTDFSYVRSKPAVSEAREYCSRNDSGMFSLVSSCKSFPLGIVRIHCRVISPLQRAVNKHVLFSPARVTPQAYQKWGVVSDSDIHRTRKKFTTVFARGFMDALAQEYL